MSVCAQPGDIVVLAYSGGLDTSIILKWLSNKGFNIICYCANVGQVDDFDAVRVKALSLGASKVYIEDLRKEFVLDAIFPAVQCNAIYESRYLLGTSLARPIIAKRQVEIAIKEGATYVSHGATGKGNDQVRFELCVQALHPGMKTIAPWRDTEFIAQFKGRADLLAYAKEHNIPVDATPKAPYSVDENLYHTSYEAGMLEDPMVAPLKDMFKMTVDPKDAPDIPGKIRIAFEKGLPVCVSDLSSLEKTDISDPLDLFLALNVFGKTHGIGRIDIVENRFVGIKSRGVYETPGGTILRAAHLDLEGLCMDREVMKVRDLLSTKFAEFAYNGFWFAPEMDFVRHAITYSQRHVTGFVDIELYKGNVTIVGRFSENPLYSADLASMDKEGGDGAIDYNPSDAQGFIRINGTRLKAYKIVNDRSKLE